jgi:hypothetical protein
MMPKGIKDVAVTGKYDQNIKIHSAMELIVKLPGSKQIILVYA